MIQLKLEINDNTTISEAMEILKQRASIIANSEETAKFRQENPHWSTLYKKAYKPYQDAVEQYEEALKLNEWLNGKNPQNGHLTIKEVFLNMSDQQRLSLFCQRVNTDIPGIFDEWLQAWWMSRY